MKLRNKKTCNIEEVELRALDPQYPLGCKICTINGDKISLKTICKYYEDVAEPLIKDEKIRKAVRAWADANSLKLAAYSADGKFYNKTIDCEIAFKTYTNRTDIPECKLLPIAELCGEED
jgi:hypothetical protein